MKEKHFNLDQISNGARIEHNIYPSLLFPAGALIRAGDLELKVLSVNDKKDTVTFQLVGVFLQPKGDPNSHFRK